MWTTKFIIYVDNASKIHPVFCCWVDCKYLIVIYYNTNAIEPKGINNLSASYGFFGCFLCLQIFIILRQSSFLSFLVLFFNLLLPVGIHLDFWGKKGRHGNEFKVGVSNQFTSQPQKGFLKVVVRLSWDIIVLKQSNSDLIKGKGLLLY